MQTNTIQDDISIVILGNFTPGKLSPKWLLSNGVITHEEWEEQDEDLIVAPPTSRFHLGNSLEWSCDESRIQVRSIK